MKLLYSLILLFWTSQVFTQMVLSGTATGGCHCYTLTTSNDDEGSIWSPNQIDLTKPFDFTFRVNLGFNDATGADGMVFVLRQDGVTSGVGGSLLGYGGITNSIGIEIDTWNSAPEVVTGDIPSDHIGMNSNGGVDHDLVGAIPIANIEDGADHDFRVVWNPATFQMDVYLDDAFIFSYVEDIVTTFFGGDPMVFFGWTGATGGFSNVQTVCVDILNEITVDDLEPCPGQEITLTDNSSSGLIYDGASIYEWLWVLPGGETADTESISITFTEEGDHVIFVETTNLIGCDESEFLTITVDSVDINIISDSITCFGFNDGAASAVASMGEVPYSFLWDDPLGQTTAEITDLSPGTYEVAVTDAAGCQAIDNVVISEPAPLLLTDVEIDSATCGLDDGEVIFHVTGGNSGYMFQLDTGLPFTTDSVFEAVSDGTYNYSITDHKGCLLEGTLTVFSDSLEVSTTTINSTCFEFDDASGTAFPAFDVFPCSFQWSDPLMQTTQTASNLAPGTYSVLVTHDEIGCAGYGEITVTEPDLLGITGVIEVDASCGVNNGSITINVAGGTLPYEYSIDDGSTYFSTATFESLGPNDYAIRIRDANGCLVGQSVTIVNVTMVPDIIIQADFPQGCQVHHVNFTNLSDPLLTAETRWNFGDGNEATGVTVSNTYPIADCYDVYVEVTTFDGCVTDSLYEDFICVWPLPIANFDFFPFNPNTIESEVDFQNLSEGAVTYHWDFGDGYNSTMTNPNHIFPETGNRTHEVQLTATTDKGCIDDISKFVTVEEVVQYYIPNAFTPNEDPFNRTFTPVFIPGFFPANYSLKIFNRWGELLFESQNPTVGWDGTYGGEIQQDGLYTWQITFKENGTDRKRTDIGHFSLLK